MCGSVQNRQPVYTPPPACPPQAPKAAPPPAHCAPVVDTFTPPPPPVVSPEKATPVAPQVASPERPTIQSAPNAPNADAARAKDKQCPPCEDKGMKKGLAKLLGVFTAVFALCAAFFARAQPKVEREDTRNDRSGSCARNWRDFEGRRDRDNRLVAPERDAIRPQSFTPSTGVRC